jgi:superoxide dismutase, Cu-Zn family
MKMKLSIIMSAVVLLLSATVSSQDMQGMQHPGKEMNAGQKTEVTKAIAVLSPAPNSQVQGMVTFEKTDKGIKITADVSGLTPGKHGFHIHEFGDCSAADYTSAGPHFMTEGESHGAPTDPMRHRGDMGNLEADANGKAHLEWVDSDISFSGANSILGRSVIIHANEDDLKTQPTGNAGARIACGTIGIAKP